MVTEKPEAPSPDPQDARPPAGSRLENFPITLLPSVMGLVGLGHRLT
jgi:hypothetical protein